MKNTTTWILFVFSAVVWILVSLWVAPQPNGPDVMIFRDAGWNLAAHGHFETRGIIYASDLRPQLFAHYTPLMPLLFAAYLKIFPQNAYAGTLFNLLLGYVASAITLFWVLRSPAEGWLKKITVLALAIFPLGMMTNDRPEALGLILSVLFLSYAARDQSKPWMNGMLAAMVFLGEPYAALMALVWFTFLTLARNWKKPRRWISSIYELSVAGAIFGLILGAVALVYYGIDHQSLHRFAEHALGGHSGAGVVLQNKQGYLQKLSSMMVWQSLHWVGGATIHELYAVAPVIFILGYTFWVIVNLRRFTPSQRLLSVAGVVVALVTVFLFPIQYNYLEFVPFFIAVCLIFCEPREGMQKPALLLVLLSLLFINLPDELFGIPVRYTERSSYREEQAQLDFVSSHLQSANSVVAFNGEVYDVYKARFPNIFNTFYLPQNRVMDISEVRAFANCYRAYNGQSGEAKPLPKGINAADFYLAQADPKHAHALIFRHKLTNAEWGFGCDVYLRNR